MTRSFARSSDERWLGGVCAGLADALGGRPSLVRLVAVALLLNAGPLLILAYLVAWAALPLVGDDPTPSRPAGFDRELLAAAAVVVGGVLLLSDVVSRLPPILLLPLGLVVAGGALVWGRTGVVADRARPLRVALGVSLVLSGGAIMLATVADLRTVGRSLAGSAVVVSGIAVIAAPGLARLARSLADERRQRIRSEERAEVAAHLHDGVLQTLALIQPRATDDREVRGLARRQERELRAWLYGAAAPPEPHSLAGVLQGELAELEDRYGVRVEAVLVGDAPLDEGGRALLAAGQEAVRNAAVHSGVEEIDVYLEVEAERLCLFVRDRGRGFDPGAVGEDRRGIADSVVGRVRRAGGTAELRSAPGEGVEVELTVPRQRAGR